jgi:crossover junction endodeoxyribonuclease RuvC
MPAASHRVKVHEYAPREIKQSVVGYGAALKDQVSHMVITLLNLNKAPQADAADALAVAICHSHMRNGLPRVYTRKRSSRAGWRQL